MRVARAAAISTSATVVGSLASSILLGLFFATKVFLATKLNGAQLVEAFAIVTALVQVTGMMGFLISFPIATILGTPMVWLLDLQISRYYQSFVIGFAVIGMILGSVIDALLFGNAVKGLSKYASPLFGGIVAALHPIIASWLTSLDQANTRAPTIE